MKQQPLWINGAFGTLGGAHVSVEDRGMQFGDGIYEVIASQAGAPILLEEHLDRWEAGAKALRIVPRLSRGERREVILRLFQIMGVERGFVYGQLTRGVAPRRHAFPQIATEATELWYSGELAPYPPDYFQQGVRVITHPDERWARCYIKSTNLLPNCLAKQKAVEEGAFEAVFHLENGVITEGSATNFYAVFDGIIRTHPLTQRILPGVTRAFVLSVARELGLPVEEKPFSRGDLQAAQETFLTSTTINVLPVTRVDASIIGTGGVGTVTRRLMEAVESALSTTFLSKFAR